MKIGIGNTIFLKHGNRMMLKVFGKAVFMKVGKCFGFYFLGFFYKFGCYQPQKTL